MHERHMYEHIAGGASQVLPDSRLQRLEVTNELKTILTRKAGRRLALYGFVPLC